METADGFGWAWGWINEKRDYTQPTAKEGLPMETNESLAEFKTRIESMPESEKDAERRSLEGYALRCAEMAAYLDYRQSHGASDQGHRAALKNLNRVGRMLWVKGFGYNAYNDISF